MSFSKLYKILFLSLFVCSISAAQPKILLYYDMEGISGVTKHSEIMFGEDDYERGRHSLTSDVNAAIEGLIAGGAGEIIIADAHGSGNPDADILLNKLDKRAKFDFNTLSNEPYIDCPDSTFDAIVCIGMHARAFTNGFISHTYTDDIAFNINGLDCSETTLIAISAARFGIPVIMVSGDDVLGKELKNQFQGIEYADVKYSHGFYECDTLTQKEARERIYNAAENAVKRIKEFKPFTVTKPYLFKISFAEESQTNRAYSIGNLKRVDEKTVSYSTNDFVHGFKQSLEMLKLAQMNPIKFFFKSLFGF